MASVHGGGRGSKSKCPMREEEAEEFQFKKMWQHIPRSWSELPQQQQADGSKSTVNTVKRSSRFRGVSRFIDCLCHLCCYRLSYIWSSAFFWMVLEVFFFLSFEEQDCRILKENKHRSWACSSFDTCNLMWSEYIFCRHRWTGWFEAHLWDKSSWNPTQRKKGKQSKLSSSFRGFQVDVNHNDCLLTWWLSVSQIWFDLSNFCSHQFISASISFILNFTTHISEQSFNFSSYVIIRSLWWGRSSCLSIWLGSTQVLGNFDFHQLSSTYHLWARVSFLSAWSGIRQTLLAWKLYWHHINRRYPIMRRRLRQCRHSQERSI